MLITHGGESGSSKDGKSNKTGEREYGREKLTAAFESIGRSPLSLRQAQVRGAYEKLVESFGPGGRGLDWAIPAITWRTAEHRSADDSRLRGIDDSQDASSTQRRPWPCCLGR